MAMVQRGGSRTDDSIDSESTDCTVPLTPIIIVKSFTITTDSYISLCSRVYDALCSKYNIGDTISESHFQYWAVILLWQRFAQILPYPETIESPFFKEMVRLPRSQNIPQPLAIYLEGIGHFRDPHGSNRKLVLPSIPMIKKISGIPYTFGQVNADTHSIYEAFPAPGIAYLRILADIRYTANPQQEEKVWDLPTELRPSALNLKLQSIKPTRNLLGWAPAKLLTKSQLTCYQSLEINKDIMENNHFDLSQKLLKKLTSKFGCYSDHYKKNGLVSRDLSDRIGSLVQGMTVERHYNESLLVDNSDMYCEGIVSLRTPYKLNGTVGKDVLVSGYRMIKEPIGGRHCWSCYDFDEYKDVPESWIQSRNMIYNYGCVGGLNDCIYSTGFAAKKVLQNEYICRTMFASDKRWNIYM